MHRAMVRRYYFSERLCALIFRVIWSQIPLFGCLYCPLAGFGRCLDGFCLFIFWNWLAGLFLVFGLLIFFLSVWSVIMVGRGIPVRRLLFFFFHGPVGLLFFILPSLFRRADARTTSCLTQIGCPPPCFLPLLPQTPACPTPPFAGTPRPAPHFSAL